MKIKKGLLSLALALGASLFLVSCTKKDTGIKDDTNVISTNENTKTEDVKTSGNDSKEDAYTVTWKNYDGTVLKVDENVKKGVTPNYSGTTPTKPSTEANEYVFDKWSPTPAKINGDVTYTASFTEHVRKYKVNINNQTGETVTVSGIVSGNSYDYNSQITLTANNVPAKNFVSWEIGNAKYTGNTFNFVVPAHEETIIVKIEPDTSYASVKYGTSHEGTADDPFTNEDALIVAKSDNYDGDKYYISGNVDSFISEPGDRLDGAVSLYLKSASGIGEKFLVNNLYKEIDPKASLTDDDIWCNGNVIVFGELDYVSSTNTCQMTGDVKLISCASNKPEPRQTIDATFAEVLNETKACANGESTYDYYSTYGYVTKYDENTNIYYLTATKGETIVSGQEANNTIILSNVTDTDVLAKLIMNAKVKITMRFKNNNNQVKNRIDVRNSEIELIECPHEEVIRDEETLEYECKHCHEKTGDRDYAMNVSIDPMHVGDTYYKWNAQTSFVNDDGALAFIFYIIEIDNEIITYFESGEYVIPAEAEGKDIYVHIYIGINDNSHVKIVSGGLDNCVVIFDGKEYVGSSGIGGTLYSEDGKGYERGYHFGIPFGKVLPEKEKTKYTITWKNYDGTELDTSLVEEGNVPSYSGNTPTKPNNGNTYYVFDGWTPSVVAATENTEYVATFKETTVVPKYTVTWLNYDGEELEVDTDVEVGTTPTYNSLTPSRADSGDYRYYYSGWDKDVSPVSGDVTYKATFEKSIFVFSGTDTLIVDGLVNSNYEGVAEIPSEFLNKDVTIIKESAFANSPSVTEIIIPSSITKISNFAFRNCTSLKKLTAMNEEDKLAEIGWSLLAGCTCIEEIALPLYGHLGTLFTTTETDDSYQVSTGGNLYFIPISLTKYIDTGGILSESAFENTLLTDIVITDNIVLINKYALNGANNLVNLTIPYVGIDKEATEANEDTLFGAIFNKASSEYTNNVNQESSHSNSNTYYIPKTLKNVTVTGGNLLWGAFSRVKGIETITISNIKKIGAYSFYHTEAQVVLSEDVETIENHAFYYFNGTGEIIIPDSVKEIGQSAFAYADGITSITVGSGVETLGSSAFSYCKGLTSITFKTTSITTIESQSFNHCDVLTTIVIPEGITTIKGQVFDYCEALVNVTLPKTLKSVKAASIFAHNQAITAITFNGTKEEFNAIEKSSNWIASTAPNLKTIHCTNGDIEL